MRPAGRTDPRIFLTIFASIATAVCVGAQTPVRITRAIEWRDSGIWLRADLHTHTRFSDGNNTVERVVGEAGQRGCDVVAITDHSSVRLTAATPEYVSAIQQARTQNPNVTVVMGLEWNVPPGTGDEHAGVLFPTSGEDLDRLATFKARFDGYGKEGDRSSLAADALRFLMPSEPATIAPAVIAHHPTRRPDSPNAPKTMFTRLRSVAPSVLVAFEGAPGHQRIEPLGAFDRGPKPVDRWDPIAAEVGGTWDQWLAEGVDAWGAVASSDFHSQEGDFWPCEFATTWIHAPERTPDGVIRALRAGSFFAEHGHNVDRAELQAVVQGASRPLVPGEAADAPVGTPLTVSLTIRPTSRDYLGGDSRIDLVELIGISSEGGRVLHAGLPSANGVIETKTTVPAGGLVVRARGRRNLADGSGLLFYTNPIRITER